jgi:peptidoglycan/xylan/chitin deacetylase (PgdA/CDA1 family)
MTTTSERVAPPRERRTLGPLAARWRDKLQHRLARCNDDWFGPRAFEATRWFGTPVMSIVCDDGPCTDLDKVVPVLAERRVRAVFAPVADQIGARGQMSATELRALVDAGHEVASHMDRHVPLHTRPAFEWSAAFGSSRARLEDACGADVTSLVYPFGHSSLAIRRIASRHFECALTTWQGINAGVLNRYAIRRHALGSHVPRHERHIAAYRLLLDQTAARSGWLVWMLHSAHPAHDTVQTQCLRQVIELAAERGIKVLTVKDAWRHRRAAILALERGVADARRHGVASIEPAQRGAASAQPAESHS